MNPNEKRLLKLQEAIELINKVSAKVAIERANMSFSKASEVEKLVNLLNDEVSAISNIVKTLPIDDKISKLKDNISKELSSVSEEIKNKQIRDDQALEDRLTKLSDTKLKALKKEILENVKSETIIQEFQTLIEKEINPKDIARSLNTGELEMTAVKGLTEGLGKLEEEISGSKKYIDEKVGSVIKRIPKRVGGSGPDGLQYVSSNGVKIAQGVNTIDFSGLTVTKTVNGVKVSGSGSSASTFLDLTDTPSSFSGEALKVARVNAGETALEFVALAGGGDALTTDPLSQFASTTSAQLAGVISDETGSGALVFGTSPTLTTPSIARINTVSQVSEIGGDNVGNIQFNISNENTGGSTTTTQMFKQGGSNRFQIQFQRTNLDTFLDTFAAGSDIVFRPNSTEVMRLTPTDVNLTQETASTILSLDASKNITSLSTSTYPSLTELSYVKGVTSAIQTQLNNKLESSDLSGYLQTSDIGSSVQAWDADLDTWATKTAPTGTVVGTSDTQALTNKTLGSGTAFSSAPTINDGVKFTFNPNGDVAGINVGSHTSDPSTSLSDGDLWYNSGTNFLRTRVNGTSATVITNLNEISDLSSTTSAKLASVISDETGSGALVFANSPTFTGTPVLPSTFTIGANSFIRSGAHNLTLTTSGTTNVTLPTTGTLATRAGTETLTNKTISGASNTITNLQASSIIPATITGQTDLTDIDVGDSVIIHDTSAGAVREATIGNLRQADINAQSGTTYTFVLGDAGRLVTGSNSSATTFTVPPNSSVAFPVGTQIDVAQVGTGKLTLAQGSGVTINSKSGNKAVGAQYVGVSLIKTATDTWLLLGDLIA